MASDSRVPKPSIRSVLRYRGLISEPPANHLNLPAIVDVLVLLELGIRFARNVHSPFHPISLLIAAFMLAYVALLIARPVRHNVLKLALIGLIALVLSLLIPMRTGEPVMTSSYVALGGLLGIYYALGTRVALACSLAYLAGMAYSLWLHPLPIGTTPGYTAAGTMGMATVLVLVGLVVNHMTHQAEFHRDLALSKARELEDTLISLRDAATVGHVGSFHFSSRTEGWAVNDDFRKLFELPEQAYPQVAVDDVLQRIMPDEVEAARSALSAPRSSELGTYLASMPNGQRFLVTFTGHTIDEGDGSWTRHGVAYQH